MEHDKSCSDLTQNRIASYNLAAIDYARIVMALFIISMHTNSLSSFSETADYYMQDYLARLAIPFFFCCNGFFLFDVPLSSGELRQKVFAQIRKLLGMYFVWTIVYMPWIVRTIVQSDDRLKAFLVFVRNSVVAGSYPVLWYLPAASLACFMVWWCIARKISCKKILLAGSILYAIGLMYKSWYGLARKLWFWDIPFVHFVVKVFLKLIVTTRNGVFFGFLMVAIGAYLSRKTLPKLRTCVLGFASTMLIGFLEVFVVTALHFTRGPDQYIFLPFATAFLFCMLLQWPFHRHRDTKKLRKLSSLLYLVHFWLIELYESAVPLLGYTVLENSLVKFGVIVGCAVFLSLFIINISEHKQFLWMKKYF